MNAAASGPRARRPTSAIAGGAQFGTHAHAAAHAADAGGGSELRRDLSGQGANISILRLHHRLRTLNSSTTPPAPAGADQMIHLRSSDLKTVQMIHSSTPQNLQYKCRLGCRPARPTTRPSGPGPGVIEQQVRAKLAHPGPSFSHGSPRPPRPVADSPSR